MQPFFLIYLCSAHTDVLATLHFFFFNSMSHLHTQTNANHSCLWIIASTTCSQRFIYLSVWCSSCDVWGAISISKMVKPWMLLSLTCINSQGACLYKLKGRHTRVDFLPIYRLQLKCKNSVKL